MDNRSSNSKEPKKDPLPELTDIERALQKELEARLKTIPDEYKVTKMIQNLRK